MDNEQPKSKKEMLLERLQQKYPGKDFSDDESMAGTIYDDYDNHDKSSEELAGYKKNEEDLGKMFAADPRSATFLATWKKGENPVIGLIRQFGPDLKEIIDSPEKQEEINKANQEYLDKVANDQKLEEEYNANLQESLQQLDALKEQGVSDEDAQKALDLVGKISNDYIMGKITPETIQIALKAINHDVDVEQANFEGEAKGKNTKIEEKLKKKSDMKEMPPMLDGGSSVAQTEKPKKDLGALGRYDGNNDIWQKGQFTRKKF